MAIPQALMSELQRGRVIPFIGSGVSTGVQPALFPSWTQLLHRLADRLVAESAEDSATIVRSYCKKGQLLRAAEEALTELGRNRFHDAMRGAFPRTCPPSADLSLPRSIWELQPAVIITTNYDSVLQWAKPDARRVLNHQSAELADLFSSADPSGPVVWHLHGHIDEADSLILGPMQYAALYEQTDLLARYRAALEQLRHAAANHTLLFVGFGLRDPYVVGLLKEVFAVFQGNSRPHFALLKAGEADTRQLWESCNVQVIEFPDFDAPQCDLLRQLAACRTSSDVQEVLSAPSHVPSPPPVPDTYRTWLARECSGVELLGLQDQQGRAVQLYQVYVPLTIAAGGDGPQPGRPPLESEALEALQRTGRDAERKPELLMGQLAEASLYVEGGAGSGKSTFCRWVAYGVNAGELPAREPAAPEGYGETFPEPLREQLPLLIRLRDFWTALPCEPGGRGLSRNGLEDALHRWLDEKQPGQLSWACVGGHLQRGRALIMLDGFDEVPIRVGPDGSAYHPRQMLLEGLADAVPHWTGQGNRVLVTSRPYGLNAAEVRRLGLRSVTIADLDTPLQELLVGRWFDALSPDAGQGTERAAEMRAHLAERAEVSPLVASPMLLTALCVIFNQGKRLPRDKHELYDRILDNVLHNRYLDEQQEIPLVRNRLSVIAYGMHTGGGLDEDRETPQAEATTAEIERLIQRYRDQSPATEPGFRGAVQACDDLLTRSGVLLPRPGKRAGFYHFTFQDFLAAQLILEREPDLAAFFRRRAGRQEWRSTLSFVFTSLMSRSVLPDKGIRLLESLIEPLTLDTLPLAVVVADCLEILAGRGVGLQARHIEQFRQLCLDAIEREAPIQPRAELGLALGRLGDPRIVEDLRDHSDPRAWVQVPAGHYTVGGGKAWGDIEPLKKQKFKVKEPFLISRYPVTNSQFRRFVQDGGYERRQWWSEEGWQWREQRNISEPDYWRQAKWNGPNQPVVGVSFWEAEAFARWAGGRLPSELEWEAAARGPQAFVYPWGTDWQDGICNTSELNLQKTTPVGLFPRARSNPLGLEDLAGNAWEWCADAVDVKYPGQSYVGRVVRGGCWDYSSVVVRSVDRFGSHPDLRDLDCGFRVVSAFSPGLA